MTRRVGLLLLVLLLATSVFSNPIDCGKRTPQVTTLEESDLNTLSLDLDQTDCRDRNICEIDCAKYVPGCNKKAYYDVAPFIGVSPKYTPRIYVDVCLRKVSTGGKSDIYTKTLIDYVRSQQLVALDLGNIAVMVPETKNVTFASIQVELNDLKTKHNCHTSLSWNHASCGRLPTLEAEVRRAQAELAEAVTAMIQSMSNGNAGRIGHLRNIYLQFCGRIVTWLCPRNLRALQERYNGILKSLNDQIKPIKKLKCVSTVVPARSGCGMIAEHESELNRQRERQLKFDAFVPEFLFHSQMVTLIRDFAALCARTKYDAQAIKVRWNEFMAARVFDNKQTLITSLIYGGQDSYLSRRSVLVKEIAEGAKKREFLQTRLDKWNGAVACNGGWLGLFLWNPFCLHRFGLTPWIAPSHAAWIPIRVHVGGAQASLRGQIAALDRELATREKDMQAPWKEFLPKFEKMFLPVLLNQQVERIGSGLHARESSTCKCENLVTHGLVHVTEQYSLLVNNNVGNPDLIASSTREILSLQQYLHNLQNKTGNRCRRQCSQ